MIDISFAFRPLFNCIQAIVIVSILLVAGAGAVRYLNRRGLRIPQWLHIFSTRKDVILLSVPGLVVIGVMSFLAS